MRANAIYVAIFLLTASSADAERIIRSGSMRLPASLRSTGGHGALGTGLRLQPQPGGGEQSRSAIEPATARALAGRLLGVRLKLAPAPRTIGDPDWFVLPAPASRKPFRPKVMIHPIGFPTGGQGVKLEVRY